MSEIKDYDKLNKSLEGIRKSSLEMLDLFTQNENTSNLRKKIIKCNEGSELLEYTTLILNNLNKNIDK